MVESGDTALVLIQVPAGLPHVYSLKGVYWTRSGANNRPLATSELRQLLLDRSESGYESKAVADAGLLDLDEGRISRYLDQVGLPPDADALQALLTHGCLTRLTAEGLPAAEPALVAGLLLFGHDPQRFLRSAEVICVRYAGET